MKLAIGVVHGDDIDGWFYTSVTDLLTARIGTLGPELLPLWDVINVRSGPALQVGRGLLVETFLTRSDADVLLMLDSDMVFMPQTIYQMWQLYLRLPEHNGPSAKILGGLAFLAYAATERQPGFIQPNLWDEEDDQLVALTDYPRDTLVEVAATGAACLMVHREVFEKIAAEQGARGLWFNHHHYPDGRPLGEDLSFCRRARKAGYPIIVHTGLRFGHTKPMVISERDYLNAGGLDA